MATAKGRGRGRRKREAEEFSAVRVHQKKACVCTCGQQLTKCKLNIPCFQLLAGSVIGKLACEGCEVVHKVICDILQDLRAKSMGLAINMNALHMQCCNGYGMHVGRSSQT